jgi:hypothetical protein
MTQIKKGLQTRPPFSQCERKTETIPEQREQGNLFFKLPQEKNADFPRSFSSSSLLDNARTNCNLPKNGHLEELKPKVTKRSDFQYSCHQKRAQQCGNAGLVLKSRRVIGKFAAVRLTCKSVECVACRTKYFNRKRKEMIHLISQGFNKFWTLTLSAKPYTSDTYGNVKATPEQQQATRENSLIDINAAWIKFRALLLKRGIKLKFIRVVEFQKNNVAHIHFLTPNYLPHSIVKYCWQKATKNSYIVLYRKLYGDSKQIANYMSKYMSKGVADYKAFYITRRRIFARSIRVLCGQSNRWTLWEIVAVEKLFIDAELKAKDLEEEEKFSKLVRDLRARSSLMKTPQPF